MAPQKPGDWARQFDQHVNADQIEAALAPYDPEARFVSPADGAVAGLDRVRQAFAGLISIRAQLQGRVVRVITAVDVALLYTDWESTAGEAHKAIELLRRQPDGTWKLIVGDPRARLKNEPSDRVLLDIFRDVSLISARPVASDKSQESLCPPNNEGHGSGEN